MVIWYSYNELQAICPITRSRTTRQETISMFKYRTFTNKAHYYIVRNSLVRNQLCKFACHPLMHRKDTMHAISGKIFICNYYRCMMPCPCRFKLWEKPKRPICRASVTRDALKISRQAVFVVAQSCQSISSFAYINTLLAV